jgi:hypothetical protein
MNIQFAYSQDGFQGNYSYASKEKLDIKELEKMSSFDLRIMRNEICARHGYIFESFFMNEFFKCWYWYKPSLSNVYDNLTELEKKNIELIKKVESGEYLYLAFKNGSLFDEGKSFFECDSNGFSIISVDYEEKYLNNTPFLIKKTKETISDSKVDGNYFMTTIELYNIKNTSDSIKCFKRIKTGDENVEIYKANKLVYQTKTPLTGGDKDLCKIVDIEDNQPFIISNSIDQIFRIRKSVFYNSNCRWISFYQTSGTDESWVYDRDWKKIERKIIDGISYHKIGTIVYAEEDYIYQMVDIFEKEQTDLKSKHLNIKLFFPEDNKPFEIESSENDIILKDDNFDCFEIGLYVDNELYKLDVKGDDIVVGNFQNEIIKIIKRDVSKYVIN